MSTEHLQVSSAELNFRALAPLILVTVHREEGPELDFTADGKSLQTRMQQEVGDLLTDLRTLTPPPLTPGHVCFSRNPPSHSPTARFCENRGVSHFLFIFFILLFIYLAFWGHTCGIWRFRGWGPIGAAAADLHHSNGNSGSEPRLQPTPQLTAMPDP